MTKLRKSRRSRGVTAAMIGGLVGLYASHAFASGAPAPGAATSMTIRLPAGPGSVRGLSDDPVLEPFSGQVSYSVPIDLPAAQRGYRPPLALGYNGSLGAGALGIGWYLSTPQISRDSRVGTPTYGSGDQLILSGMAKGGRLVPVGDGSFRVEGLGNEIVVKSTPEGGFLVKDSDGLSYRLGVSSGGRQSDSSAPATRVSSWFVEEILDVDGRSLCRYSYLKDLGQVYLDKVSWGPQDKFFVQFVMEARSDVLDSYRTGYKVTTARRVHAIEVHSFGALLRTYTMTYDESLPLTRLKRVDQTGLEGAGHMPPLTFSYGELERLPVTQVDATVGWQLGVGGVTLADLDGDGASDLVKVSPTGHYWRRNLGATFSAPRRLSGADGASLTNARLADVEGRAIPNLVTTDALGKWRPYHIQGDGWTVNSTFGAGTTDVPLLAANDALMDVNGDGRIDVIKSNGVGLIVYLGKKDGLAPGLSRPLIANSMDITPDLRWEDVNGDRIADAIKVTADSSVIYVGKGDGYFEPGVTVRYPWHEVVDPSDIRFADLNRDGIVDLVSVVGTTVRWYAGLPPFGFSSTPVTLPRPSQPDAFSTVELGDVNGNGSIDVVWSTNEGLWLLDPAGSTHAGMLVGVDNGLGKRITFDYASTVDLAQRAEQQGQNWTYLLPASIPVATASTVHLSSGEPDRRVEYEVRDGFWDSDEVAFGGFLLGIKRTPNSAAVKPLTVQTRYNSGLALSRVLRGKPIDIWTYLGSDLISYEHQVWVAQNIAGLPTNVALLKMPVLRRTETSLYEGLPSGTSIMMRTRYTQDTEGRDIRKDEDGRVDVTGDERSTTWKYADDLTTWVRSRVCDEQLFDATGTLVSRTQTYFGDASRVGSSCEALQGWPRKSVGSLIENGVERAVVLKETSYDSFGNVLSNVEGGVRRAYTYDAYSLHPITESLQPDSTRTLTWTAAWDNARGLIKSVTTPDGALQYVNYDALNRVTGLGVGNAPEHVHYEYMWDGPQPPTTATYSYSGRPENLAPWPGTWTPGSGWREQISVANGASETLYNATRLTSSRWIVNDWTERDAYGKVIFRGDSAYWDDAELPTVRPSVTGETLVHDGLGRVVDETLPSGSHRRTTYSALSQTVTTDGLSPVTSSFDGLGRVAATQRPDKTGALQSVSAEYDVADHLTAMTLQGSRVAHRFTYDSLGHLTHAQDPDIGPRDMTYDESGRLRHVVNGESQSIDFTYDGAGRLSTQIGSDGTTFRYHYDTAAPGQSSTHVEGRLSWVEEPTGSISLGYDALGHIILAKRTIDGQSVEETSVVSPSGALMERRYDDGFSLTYTYDDAGRPRKVGDYWELVDQNAAGDPVDERYGNGVTEHSERPFAGQLTGVLIKDPAGSKLYDVSVEYNEWLGIKHIADNDHVGIDHTASFEYDGFARLTSAALGVGAGQINFGYEYDLLQNMTSRTQSGGLHAPNLLLGAYQYGTDASGPRQLQSVVDPSGTVHALAYDRAGRQTGQDNLRLVYNSLDQLLRVEGVADGHGGGSAIVRHAYGYDGSRIKTIGPGGDITYWFSDAVSQRDGVREYAVLVGDRIVARVTSPLAASVTASSGGSAAASAIRAIEAVGVLFSIGAMFWVLLMPAHERRRRSLGARSTAAILLGSSFMVSCGGTTQPMSASTVAIGTQTVIYMHRGIAAGPTLLTGPSGELLEDRRYEPFGEDLDAYRKVNGSYVVAPVDFVTVDVNDLNKHTEPATGWSYHGARWMNPGTARWLTPDPPTKGPDAKFMRSPWSLNPYQYVEQNPITFWDPDGRDKMPKVYLAWPGGAQGRGIVNVDIFDYNMVADLVQHMTPVDLNAPGIARDLDAIQGSNFLFGSGIYNSGRRDDGDRDIWNVGILSRDVSVRIVTRIGDPHLVSDKTYTMSYSTGANSNLSYSSSNTEASDVKVSGDASGGGLKGGVSVGSSESSTKGTTIGSGASNGMSITVTGQLWEADVYQEITVLTWDGPWASGEPTKKYDVAYVGTVKYLVPQFQ